MNPHTVTEPLSPLFLQPIAALCKKASARLVIQPFAGLVFQAFAGLFTQASARLFIQPFAGLIPDMRTLTLAEEQAAYTSSLRPHTRHTNTNISRNSVCRRVETHATYAVCVCCVCGMRVVRMHAYADLDAEEGRVYVNALKRKLLLHRALVSYH